MRILLIGINFYDYEAYICQKIKSQGNDVIHVSAAPKMAKFAIVPHLVKKLYIYIHQKLIIKRFKHTIFDIILFIVGRQLSHDFMYNLKRDHPNAKFILYLWDDVNRVKNFHSNKQFYDEIYSFDCADCKKYGFKYLPLFFIDNYRMKKTFPLKTKIFSTFAIHSDRIDITKKLLSSTNASANIIFISFRQWLLKEKLEKRIHIKPWRISMKKVIDMVSHTLSLFDIQHPSQNGLTIRTFEALASNTKLITTNSSIRYYDFYNPRNIAIIDRDNPVIPDNFLDTPYESLPDKIVDKYSLENWLGVIFNGKKEKYLIENNPYGSY